MKDSELKELARLQGLAMARGVEYATRKFSEQFRGSREATKDQLLDSQYKIVSKPK